MAKPKSKPKLSPEPAGPAAAFKRGLLSVNLKFGLFTGVGLGLLLGLVGLIVSTQLRDDLTREVAERGNTVARNVATKAAEIARDDDDLTMAVLLKGSVEAQAPQTMAGAWKDRAMAVLRGSTSGERKNDGVARIVVLKDADEKNLSKAWDSNGLSVTETDLPKSVMVEGEPYPSFTQDGQAYFDISNPMVLLGRTSGKVRLFLRKAVINDAVFAAIVRLAAVMLLSLGAGVLFLLLVVRILLKPVAYLQRGVTAVAAGNFNVHIGLKRGDELGDLIDSYNQMASSLKEKEAVQEALAKYTSKDLVDQLVSDKAQLDLGGQRIHATIFFSVVHGMHALSATMDAEDYVGLVNEYLEVETDVIMKNGGSIDKFIGDEVMAVWGLRGEDPAEAAYNAVNSGVEIQEAVAELNAKREAKGKQAFQLSIGINNGEVVSGNMGSSAKMDFTVLGGNVNLAARLGLVAAKAGQTIISKSVYNLVAKRFKVDTLDAVPLKGIKEPVPLYWPRKALR